MTDNVADMTDDAASPNLIEELTYAGELLSHPTVHSISLSMADLEEVYESQGGSDLKGTPDPREGVDIDDAISVDVSMESFVALPGSSPPPTPPPLPLDTGAPSKHAWIEDQGEIARGGMGRIHRVRHAPLRHLAVMKVLDPGKTHTQTHQRRFLEEAQITGQLDHPNIPPVHDLWLAEDGTLRFTMKLVEGRTLSEILRARPPSHRQDRQWEQLLDILLKTCDAVAFAHSRGVIHRDLKPDNIMIGSHGQVWVMDWGLATLLPSKVGETGCVTVLRDIVADPLDPPETILGTPAYMAPEQAWGRIDEIDERTDIYLLGATLYATLANKPPHVGKNMADAVRRGQGGEVDELDAERRGLPPELCRIALRALSTNPKDRYESVDELRDELAQTMRRGLWYRTATFLQGALVVRQGDPADAAYTIIDGSCEVFRTEEGQRISLRRMGPGETFGETAIFTQKTRTASVEVVDGEMTATVISRGAFDRALGDSWLRPFVLALASRFQELDDREALKRAQEASQDG
ncbi:MAG: protein kinase [Deltaproteobacteria bacterium]|nr:protein kinase [Deltaproteobacteria bacterium]